MYFGLSRSPTGGGAAPRESTRRGAERGVAVLGDDGDREQLVEQRAGLAVERRPVALVEGVDEALVGGHQDEAVRALAAQL